MLVLKSSTKEVVNTQGAFNDACIPKGARRLIRIKVKWQVRSSELSTGFAI
jgi:hypothetical protein